MRHSAETGRIGSDDAPDGEVTHGKTGLFYKLGSPNRGADQVEVLLTDTAMRRACGLNGRKAILARHGPDQAIPVLVQVLWELVRRPVNEAADLHDPFSDVRS